MAGEVTNEEVQASRERVNQLTEELAQARVEAAAGARSGENEYRKQQLDTEAARLQAEIDALRAAAAPTPPSPPAPTATAPTRERTAPEPAPAPASTPPAPPTDQR